MLGWNAVPRELTDCSRALLDVLTSSWEEKAGMATCITYWLPDDWKRRLWFFSQMPDILQVLRTPRAGNFIAKRNTSKQQLTGAWHKSVPATLSCTFHRYEFGSGYTCMGAGIAQWLLRQTRDRKVAGSNPCRRGGRIFFSRVNFVCWLLFWYLFHPQVTAVGRKRPRSLCQKCRWQVTAKHAYILRMWLCMKWHGAWLYGVHRMRQDGSSFMWHQPCQRCKYTTSVDIQKNALFTHVESHASAVSLLNSGEWHYVKAISNNGACC